MNLRSDSKKAPAFTLTEVLVAVSVVAVLASLLLPTLKNSLSGAQASRCLSNLRQIGVAMHSYASENNQEFPKSYPADNTTWMWKLIPYADMKTNSMGVAPLPRSAGIFVCGAFKANNPQRNVSYAYNTFIDPATGFPWEYRRNAVPSPAKTFLVVEINANGELFSPNNTPDVTRRHPKEAANFLFVDCHVETIREKIPATDSRWKWDVQ